MIVFDLADSLLSFDGLKIEPQYEPPVFSGAEPAAEIANGKIYTGSCHCGAVKVAVKSPPIDSTYEDRILECNCSICQRVRRSPKNPNRTCGA